MLRKLQSMMKTLSNKVKDNIREIVLYVVFGFLTTLISIVSYWIFTRVIGIGYQYANVLSWIAAVAFAFATNKIFVFRDKGKTSQKLILFWGSRLFTLILETGLLYLGIEVVGINDFIAKIFVQAVVIVVNYLMGKLVVFRRTK